MISKSIIFFPILLLWTLFSCEEEKMKVNPTGSYFLENEKQDGASTRVYLSSKSIIDEKGNKKIEEVKYSMGIVSAIEFIAKKGRNSTQNELSKLKSESVAILEFEPTEEHKNIFEAKRNSLNKDKTIEYLMGNIAKDITIEQGGIIYNSNDLLYENSFSKQNRIRLYFFFTGIKSNEEMKIMYHDRLYGAGLINFRINRNHEI